MFIFVIYLILIDENANQSSSLGYLFLAESYRKLFLLHLCRNPLKVYLILLISQRATRFMDILICWTFNKFLPWKMIPDSLIPVIYSM